jgi:hypothetical protein
MDGSQITGTSSSYARKNALNGLFAIDDTKDADTNESAAKVESMAMDIMTEIWMINDAQSIADLVKVWSTVGNKFKGKKELKDLIKAKDTRKSQLMGEA